MKTLFVGLDVSKDDFKAAVKDDQNNLVMPVKTYCHDKPSLEAFTKDIGSLKEQFRCGAIFGMEATGIYHLSFLFLMIHFTASPNPPLESLHPSEFPPFGLSPRSSLQNKFSVSPSYALCASAWRTAVF